MKLLDKFGWDVITKQDYIFFQKIEPNDSMNSKSISKFAKSDLITIWEISEKEFNVAKFGPNYEKFFPMLGSNKDSVIEFSNGSLICTGFMDYYFYFIDQFGEVVSKREDIGFDNIYSIDIDSNGFLWFVIPFANYIGQYSLELSQDIYSFGDKYDYDGPLNSPEDLKIYNDYAYISNMGSNSIIKLNTNTKEWNTYLQFDQPTWEYRQWKGKEIVRLESGIFILEEQ